MRGYGQQRPGCQMAWWQAKIAVQFVLNYEEGGENCILHGDAGFRGVSLGYSLEPHNGPVSAIGTWRAIYEYGARAGFWRLHRLFTGAGIPLTIYGRGHSAGAQPRTGARHEGPRAGRLPATG